MMKKKRNNRGFTMAELLIVVGIIVILSGVGFIAVQTYQKSMGQLEADAIAKEIFIAAQNHLTMAESQGYMSKTIGFGTDATLEHVVAGETEEETPATNESQQPIYRFDVPGSSFDGSSVLGLMLPFGSIDETIRIGGNYVIYYQANPARVLDVFYGSTTGRYAASPVGETYSNLRTTSEDHSDNIVIGWYGGADTQESGVKLNAPAITVENAERLTVTVDASAVNVDNTKTGTDTSIIGATDLSLKLLITNADETAMAAIPLDVYTAKKAGGALSDSNSRVSKVQAGTVNSDTELSTGDQSKVYRVVLDDITTANMHFADINNDSAIDKLGVSFKPGEDIIVYAVAYSNTTLCNIVTSNAITVNSLFADCHVDKSETGKRLTAYIGNFRHLENLDGAVSGVGTGSGEDAFTVQTAEQIVDLGAIPTTAPTVVTPTTAPTVKPSATPAATATPGSTPTDLSWTGFVAAIKAANKSTAVQVYTLANTPATATADGKYRPVSPSYELTYNGNSHSITNVSAAGAVADGTGPAGLFGEPAAALTVSDLVLYDFDISGSDAGALAGKLPAGSSVTNVLAYHGETARTVTATGNAGGLVGSITAGSDASVLSTVTNSAAAMRVSSTGTEATVSAGGLIGSAANVTVTDSYSGGHTTGGKYSTADYNVTAEKGNAGGLIGAASGTTSMDYCYSTCSAGGKVAGGLIGAASGVDIAVTNSYAVGKTSGNDAFLGSGILKGLSITDFDHVHAVDIDSGDLVMPETPKTGDDADPEWKKRTETAPYDTVLSEEKYPFSTVTQLRHLVSSSYEEPENLPVHMSKHFGDWQEVTLQADVNLELINAERLSAKITLPKAQIEDGGMITMLIRGEATHAIVENDAYASATDAYLRFRIDKQLDNTYALSLSPDSSVPGVEAANLKDWLEKKAGAVFAITDTDVAEIVLSLDDITKEDGHFAQLFRRLIPGENIIAAVKGGMIAAEKLNEVFAGDWEVQDAVTPTKTYVIAARTNSLFADPDTNLTDTMIDGSDVDKGIAAIANFRHLENLDAGISSRETRLDDTVTGGKSITFTNAYQIRSLVGENITDEEATDGLNWMGFLSKISGVTVDNLKTDEPDNAKMIKVYKIDNTTGGHICFIPVNPGAIAYDGQGHSIGRVYVNTAENAGLFGTLPSGCTVSKLKLIDFEMKSTGEAATAGALAGVNSGATITNVLAFNENHDKMTATVTAGGSAGGLIGSMTGGSVTHCAAALVVNSTGGDAGGLIGAATGGTVSGSYSGGHTSGGAYDDEHFNVTATGNAGGLIGNAIGATKVEYCYSTCSATGATAGGLVGQGGTGIENCYATGLVNGTTKGAFAGSIGTASGCLYFEAVNPGMPATGGTTTVAGITELDADANSYDSFVGAPADWRKAQPYDSTLADYYKVSGETRFNLGTAARLGLTEQQAAGSDPLFVATHYGDWPAPEIFVVN